MTFPPVHVLVGAIIFVVAIAFAVRAAPPENADPALVPWFESLMQPGTRSSCCGAKIDCRATEARHTAKGYEVLLGGKPWNMPESFWVPVPPEKILQRTDNPIGRPVACWRPAPTAAGGWLYCFIRGPES